MRWRILDCAVCDCVRQQLDNWCTKGEMCCIGREEDNQGNTMHVEDPIPGGQEGILRSRNSGERWKRCAIVDRFYAHLYLCACSAISGVKESFCVCGTPRLVDSGTNMVQI